MDEIPIFFGTFFAAFVIGYVWKAKLGSGDVSIIMVIGLATMLISMPFTPSDKDGNLMLLWTIPYLLCGLVGASVGLALERLRRKEQ